MKGKKGVGGEREMGSNIPSKEDEKNQGFMKPIQVTDIFVSLQMLLYKEWHNIKIHFTGRREKLWRRAQRTALQSLLKPVEHTSSWGWPALIATLLPSNDRRKGVRTAAESK